MIINKIDGAMKSVELCTDDLELVVAAANIVGYMEKAGEICVDSDSRLAKFCVEVVEQYCKEETLYPDFPEYVQNALLNEFYVEV